MKKLIALIIIITAFSNQEIIAQENGSSYKTAIGAAKAQLIYKKLTGTPSNIEFFQ